MLTKAQKLVIEIEAYNNTQAWEYQGRIYIDSLKYPRVFERFLFQECGIDPKLVDFQIHYQPTKREVLYGDEATGIEFGGRKTIAWVCSFRATE